MCDNYEPDWSPDDLTDDDGDIIVERWTEFITEIGEYRCPVDAGQRLYALLDLVAA